MRSIIAVAVSAAVTLAACANTKTASSMSDAGAAGARPMSVLHDSRVELDPSKPVATIGSTTITGADLDKSVDEDLQKTTDDYVEKVHDIRKQGLDGLVAEKLVDMEAKSRALTTDQLLKQEVQDKAPKPSDADVEAFYEKNVKPQYPVPLDQIKDKIVERMTQEAVQKRLRQYIDELKLKYKPTEALPEMPVVRFNVAATGPSKGPADAKVTIVEFSDFQCPFCGRAFGTVNEVMKKYEGKVRLVFRQYPLPFHEHAEKAAEAALCANEQGKFWEMHDQLFTHQENLEEADLKKYAKDIGLDEKKFDECLTSGRMAAVVEKDKAAGEAAKVNGTPAFFINGRSLSGAQPLDAFSEVIDSELNAKK